ncbi:hypothetical protein [Streptomyces pseudovenezuelae]|uniref:Uncharacterized protein n=1 Tax=Streptomyces pseudovenezuelae TaxID=67350 RepID=A0ABT6LTX4_9ACTN|nr:hypothetical protein [Streptomyces pseudovenezuelae]MDH6219756.1 hypothetical protein [Streptomyces pseudovenezuelae]
MAVLAVLIPPFMLGLVLALDRYEELLLPGTHAERSTQAVAPPEPAAEESPAPSPRIPAPAIADSAPRLGAIRSSADFDSLAA